MRLNSIIDSVIRRLKGVFGNPCWYIIAVIATIDTIILAICKDLTT
jgi:hypothetical protein